MSCNAYSLPDCRPVLQHPDVGTGVSLQKVPDRDLRPDRY